MNQADLKIFLEQKRQQSLSRKISAKEAFVDLGCFSRQIPDKLFMAEFHKSEGTHSIVGKIVLRDVETRKDIEIVPAFVIPMDFPGGAWTRNAEVILNGAGHIIVLEWY